ncbi:MAG: cytochrome d ubiquinol oxidase subunit II [Stygiobacter sp. RIFOXYC12_FULL_38_8]|nr:MAG: cytochrome d ubiquinol oxidase subunit II [Stygiobacter sp. GWC2_38_9]OGV07401.1 MAG: cytochrome d ubiquinol oxidase subunit II [Stygiobacter sp. RIFOXYB2_FULL_37_11]OGV14704.1 MAG: cytochrome d ubiquinol oxidase subunit II [Stygiobacter sp. RIFOXYC2_FULL_38_25]OGV25151.1 MAG: cytochrome d ubiquinol oxidase subunit II [Stygiobacter sp. RIFOXYC12_FULL_38_8]OGV79197.1 MAG: cytochrome d ubiquinol oxidase subunit II [Stygiobacter sp. GWF2_38_21]RJQ62723.1 MAG: cytochrome d ubiquinol oxidas
MEFTFDLNTIWFILIGVLLSGYAILDGFDLGVGTLHLLIKNDNDRRVTINSIGPVWDGNEVWLVTGGGALFAAFPQVYATVFSGFYTAIILLLFSLIFRAIAIEFRSKQPMKWWRQTWDVSFSVSSILIAFLMGVALGNIITGIPLDADKEFAGSFLSLIKPYTVLVGITTVALFMMHGSIYVVMKTEGELQNKIRSWVNNTIIFFVICYVTTTMYTLIYYPHMVQHFKDTPVLFLVAVLNMLAIANIPREIFHGREFRAFLSSCASIASLLALFAIGLFPNIVLSDPNPANSLTIYNASSSQKTLGIMLTIAILGIPFVLAYTISIYWIFRGKVKLDSMSY